MSTVASFRPGASARQREGPQRSSSLAKLKLLENGGKISFVGVDETSQCSNSVVSGVKWLGMPGMESPPASSSETDEKEAGMDEREAGDSEAQRTSGVSYEEEGKLSERFAAMSMLDESKSESENSTIADSVSQMDHSGSGCSRVREPSVGSKPRHQEEKATEEVVARQTSSKKRSKKLMDRRKSDQHLHERHGHQKATGLNRKAHSLRNLGNSSSSDHDISRRKALSPGANGVTSTKRKSGRRDKSKSSGKQRSRRSISVDTADESTAVSRTNDVSGEQQTPEQDNTFQLPKHYDDEHAASSLSVRGALKSPFNESRSTIKSSSSATPVMDFIDSDNGESPLIENDSSVAPEEVKKERRRSSGKYSRLEPCDASVSSSLRKDDIEVTNDNGLSLLGAEDDSIFDFDSFTEENLFGDPIPQKRGQWNSTSILETDAEPIVDPLYIPMRQSNGNIAQNSMASKEQLKSSSPLPVQQSKRFGVKSMLRRPSGEGPLVEDEKEGPKEHGSKKKKKKTRRSTSVPALSIRLNKGRRRQKSVASDNASKVSMSTATTGVLSEAPFTPQTPQTVATAPVGRSVVSHFLSPLSLQGGSSRRSTRTVTPNGALETDETVSPQTQTRNKVGRKMMSALLSPFQRMTSTDISLSPSVKEQISIEAFESATPQQSSDGMSQMDNPVVSPQCDDPISLPTVPFPSEPLQSALDIMSPQTAAPTEEEDENDFSPEVDPEETLPKDELLSDYLGRSHDKMLGSTLCIAEESSVTSGLTNFTEAEETRRRKKSIERAREGSRRKGSRRGRTPSSSKRGSSRKLSSVSQSPSTSRRNSDRPSSKTADPLVISKKMDDSGKSLKKMDDSGKSHKRMEDGSRNRKKRQSNRRCSTGVPSSSREVDRAGKHRQRRASVAGGTLRRPASKAKTKVAIGSEEFATSFSKLNYEAKDATASFNRSLKW